MCWYGADPGGTNCFGVAALRDNGTFQTWCVSSVDEALRYISKPSAIGIDCPLWWSSGPGGWRRADRRLINACGREGILAVNSLRGAVLVQGVVLAVRLREMDRNIGLSETHPKALLRALNLSRWWT